ncbi:MAG: dicarboxylate/amino acid:cation symporter [bacterium]
MTLRAQFASPTGRVLAALIVGLIVGVSVAALHDSHSLTMAIAIEPIGVLWVNAIRMTVIPLVVSLLIVGVADRSSVALGLLGKRSLITFIALLGISSLYSIVAVTWSMHWLHIDPVTSAAMRAGVTAAAEQTSAAIHSAPGFRDWLVSLVPTNPVQAAATGALLPLIVFTLFFALALSRLDAGNAKPVLDVFRAIAAAMLTLVRWVIALAPIGVFALIVPTTARLGAAAAGALGYYTAATIVLTLGMILLVYPVVALTTGISMRVFARAALPGQIVAFGTSSSLAALPALIDGAERELRLPTTVRGFVLPLAASTFKIGSPVAKVTGALFLARLYGVEVGITQVFTLVTVSVLLSFSTPGVPHSWLVILAPMLSSVGVPPEGVGLLMAVDVIPDMMFTTLNATGYLAAAAIVGSGSQTETREPIGALSS